MYYKIAGGDADFVIGGDIAALDFRADLQKLRMRILVVAGRFDRVSIHATRWSSSAMRPRRRSRSSKTAAIFHLSRSRMRLRRCYAIFSAIELKPAYRINKNTVPL